MKKIIAIIMATIICFTLAACGTPFKTDSDHATVSITTSNGDAYVYQTLNGSNATVSGREMAIRNTVQLTMKKGEAAHVSFKCDSCGNEQEYDIKEAWAEVLSCDCPDEIDDNNNIKEYSALSISFKE